MKQIEDTGHIISNKFLLLKVGIFVLLVFSFVLFFLTAPLRRDLDTLKSLQGSGIVISGNSLMVSGGLSLSGLQLFADYQDHPLWRSSLLINDVYNHLLAPDPTATVDALALLDEATILLSGSFNSSIYSLYEKKLLTEQLHTLDVLHVVASIKSCLIGPVYSVSSLEDISTRLNSMLIRMQQFESEMYNVLQTLSSDEDRRCLESLIAENRQLQAKIFQLNDQLVPIYMTQEQRAREVVQDMRICLDPAHSYQTFDSTLAHEFVSSLEERYKAYDTYALDSIIEKFCNSGDAPSQNMGEKLEELLDTVGQQSAEGESQSEPQSDTQGGEEEDSTSEGDGSQPEKAEYDDVVPAQTQGYIEQLQDRSEEYQQQLEEFLQGNTSPDVFLRDQYKEFYGEDKDFVEQMSGGDELKKGEW